VVGRGASIIPRRECAVPSIAVHGCPHPKGGDFNQTGGSTRGGPSHVVPAEQRLWSEIPGTAFFRSSTPKSQQIKVAAEHYLMCKAMRAMTPSAHAITNLSPTSPPTRVFFSVTIIVDFYSFLFSPSPLVPPFCWFCVRLSSCFFHLWLFAIVVVKLLELSLRLLAFDIIMEDRTTQLFGPYSDYTI
jgi:hypothetical protein